MNRDVDRLIEENRKLRALLAQHGIGIPDDPPAASPATNVARSALTPEAKVKLFREVFRAREDVYAVRWESPDGRKGYSPKTERDWKAYYAAQPPDRAKVDRETRKCLPITDDVIRAHLTGDITAGVYPLLRDETCWFLAVDFDKADWQEDSRAFLDSRAQWDVPAALERSRSGKGGHHSLPCGAQL